MASQGQRFRRKALRRGYKVEEVDSFLDRVEATLAGEPLGVPVASQEVHDVVFRVRFGGYDEWQVDLHLDRVERQVAELEERGGAGGRSGDPRMAERMGPPDRLGPPDRMGPPDRPGPAGPPDRMGPPMRDGGFPAGPPPMPARPMPAQAGPPTDPYGRYDEPTGTFGGLEPQRGGGFEPQRGGFEPQRGGVEPPQRGGVEPPQRGGFEPPQRGGGFEPPQRGGFEPPQRGGFEPPQRGGFEPQRGPGGPIPSRGPTGPGGPDGFGSNERFDGFDPSRHGKADMTAEIRLPDRDLRGPGRGPGGPPPLAGPPMGGPPVGPPMGGGPAPLGPSGMGGPPGGGGGGDMQRVDQIRRTFQVRRFGSGYDPDQVDQLFEGILGGMAGRGPMPVNPADLDTTRFGLVPGGYFEAEVDAALKEVKDILRGH